MAFVSQPKLGLTTAPNFLMPDPQGSHRRRSPLFGLPSGRECWGLFLATVCRADFRRLPRWVNDLALVRASLQRRLRRTKQFASAAISIYFNLAASLERSRRHRLSTSAFGNLPWMRSNGNVTSALRR